MEKIKLLNNALLAVLLIVSIILIGIALVWLPKISQSTINLNNAKCLESYNNQGQAPLGACGYEFKK